MSCVRSSRGDWHGSFCYGNSSDNLFWTPHKLKQCPVWSKFDCKNFYVNATSSPCVAVMASHYRDYISAKKSKLYQKKHNITFSMIYQWFQIIFDKLPFLHFLKCEITHKLKVIFQCYLTLIFCKDSRESSSQSHVGSNFIV